MNEDGRTAFFLGHIVEAVVRIQSYVQGLDEAGFLGHKLVQDAVVRNLEVIGEACSNVRKHDPAFVSAHPEVPWGDAIGNRNALSHGYFNVDYVLAWNTIHGDLPKLRRAIAALLA